MANPIRFVEDGQELMDYLQRTGKYADSADSPWPGIILLDLDMPLQLTASTLASCER